MADTLQDIDVDTEFMLILAGNGTPPCELLEEDGRTMCGRPSCRRIYVLCKCGEKGKPIFVCVDCLRHIENWGVACTNCKCMTKFWAPA